MSVRPSFDIESATNISRIPFSVQCTILNHVFKESSTLPPELIGNRFAPLSKKVIYPEAQKKAKTNLERMEELGLLGAIEDSEVTSKNYKTFIKKTIKKRHGKGN